MHTHAEELIIGARKLLKSVDRVKSPEPYLLDFKKALQAFIPLHATHIKERREQPEPVEPTQDPQWSETWTDK